MQYTWKSNDDIHQPNIGCNVNLVDNVQYAWKSHLVVPPNTGFNVNVVMVQCVWKSYLVPPINNE
jgi:hypothetical protein